MKIKSLPKNFWSSVLNFTTPRYAFLFSNSKTYIVHVINFEWSRFVNFSAANVLYMIQTCIFPTWYKHVFFLQMVSERSSILNCLTCFVSFGIRESNFMLLEDYTLNFLHDHWNYFFIKTDIDVMLLFKFEFKFVKLIFMAIASMEFSFDINLCLSCSYDACLFMKNRWKLP